MTKYLWMVLTMIFVSRCSEIKENIGKPTPSDITYSWYMKYNNLSPLFWLFVLFVGLLVWVRYGFKDVSDGIKEVCKNEPWQQSVVLNCMELLKTWMIYI